MSNHQNIIGSWRWLNSPEWNVAVFSFLLSFFWEIQQMPFYQVSSEFSCFDRTRNCTLATVGDVGISLIAFWVVAVLSKSRRWVQRPSRRQIIIYTFVGVVITVVFEALATGLLGVWAYAEIMPTIPFLGTGLVPLSMWFLIPSLTIWFVQRQLSHVRYKSSEQL
jgi:membrane protease YdiL (CAAX protease family)